MGKPRAQRAQQTRVNNSGGRCWHEFTPGLQGGHAMPKKTPTSNLQGRVIPHQYDGGGVNPGGTSAGVHACTMWCGHQQTAPYNMDNGTYTEGGGGGGRGEGGGETCQKTENRALNSPQRRQKALRNECGRKHTQTHRHTLRTGEGGKVITAQWAPTQAPTPYAGVRQGPTSVSNQTGNTSGRGNTGSHT